MDRELDGDTQSEGVDSLRIEGLILRLKADGRQVYDARAKAALVKLCRKPGVSVARAALENGVNANLLRKWMKAKRATRAKRQEAVVSGTSASEIEAPNVLLPIVLKPKGGRLARRTEVRPDSRSTMTLEIELARGIVRIGSIDAQGLRGVIELLSQRDR